MRAIVVLLLVAGMCFGSFVEFGTEQMPSAKPFCGS